MGKKTSSHIIHSLGLGGEYYWIVRDSEPIRLLKSPRSLSVYILNVISYLWQHQRQFLTGARENRRHIHKNYENTGKILKISLCKMSFIFSGSHKKFSLVLLKIFQTKIYCLVLLVVRTRNLWIIFYYWQNNIYTLVDRTNILPPLEFLIPKLILFS